jgi:hypothetical protein
VLLSDGSVQGGYGLGKAYTLVQKEGKTVFQSLEAPRMNKRYGLEPKTAPNESVQPQDDLKFE